MVRALEEEEEEENLKSRLCHFQGIREAGGRQAHSMDLDSNNGSMSPLDDRIIRSHSSGPLNDQHLDKQKIGSALNRLDKIKSRLGRDGGSVNPLSKDEQSSDMEIMKERFSKLLLGEDMSGGGKGVSSALALSNAITNLAASVFSEHKRLEPMPAEMRSRWRKEIDWLLSVTDHIVEFAPCKQNKDGITMEIMTTRQRTDILMNIPALRKLDAMLIDCLENFKDQNEFTYTSKNSDESQKGKNKRNDDKWWIPTPKVPPNGLSDVTRKLLQFQKDSLNQVLKASMAINAQILSEMEIPENYIESLPKNGKTSLGDLLYKSITTEYFDPDLFLSTMDLTSEHKILDLKNRIEASMVIWKRKMNAKDGKSSWGSSVSLEKREQFEERLETILLILKHRYPGIPQSALDISKIQYNRDVGHAVLESYSRILESLVCTVMSSIEDVLHADSVAQNPSIGERKGYSFRECPSIKGSERFPNAEEELERLNTEEAPASMTLLDFMGWNVDQGDADPKNDSQEDLVKDGLSKPPNIVTNKKFSYLDKLEKYGLRSPTARH